MKKTILLSVVLAIISLQLYSQLICDPESPNLVSNPDMDIHGDYIHFPEDQALTNLCAWEKAVPTNTNFPWDGVWFLDVTGLGAITYINMDAFSGGQLKWAGFFQNVNVKSGTTVDLDINFRLVHQQSPPLKAFHFLVCLTNADVLDQSLYENETLTFTYKMLLDENGIDLTDHEYQNIIVSNVPIEADYSTLAIYMYQEYYSSIESSVETSIEITNISVDWVNLYQHELTVDAGENSEQCIDTQINIGGDPTAFGGVPGTGYTYQWTSIPSGFSANVANPEITVDMTKTYRVTVRDHSIPQQVVTDYVTIVAVDCSLPNVLRVDASNPHIVANDGTSWDLAFTHLQDALTAASNNPEIDQIWIAEGTYYPDWNGSYHTGIRTDKFTMLEGVAIYGGFQGTELYLEERSINVEDFPTILSGNINKPFEEIDNSYTIVSYNEITRGVIDRVTIKEAYSDYGWDEHPAFVIISSNVTMKNCIVSNNKLYPVVIGSSDILMQNCIFDGNQGESTVGGWGSSIQMTDCEITNNLGYPNEGGIVNFVNSTLNMTSCLIEGNNHPGQEGGVGGIRLEATNATIEDCDFIRNCAYGFTALFIHDNINYFEDVKVLVKDCRFTENGIESNSLSGAIGIYFMKFSNPINVDIENCIFNNNTSRVDWYHYDGTAIKIGFKGDETNNEDFINIKNNTFYNNQNINQYYEGHEIFAESTTGSYNNIKVINCILWDGQGNPKIGTSDGSNLLVTHSDVEGGYGLPIDNNIDTDPFFADPLNGDFHLQSPNGRWDPDFGWVYTDTQCSPCIDAGDPASGGGGGTEPEIPNMGAYGNTSFQSKTCATTKSLLMASDESNSLSETFFDCFLSPNPISKSLKIELNLSNDSEVEVSIFDLMGRKSRTINSGYLTSGNTIMYWNGDDDANNELPNGVYLVVVKSNSTSKSFKVVIKR